MQILWLWGHYETARIWIDLFQNHILFCKFLGPLISYRNGFVFKIYVWISVFRRKKGFENLVFGCREIMQKWSLIFLGHPVYRCWTRKLISHSVPNPSEITSPSIPVHLNKKNASFRLSQRLKIEVIAYWLNSTKRMSARVIAPHIPGRCRIKKPFS